jgi:uncharacterized protein (DUF433 family)
MMQEPKEREQHMDDLDLSRIEEDPETGQMVIRGTSVPLMTVIEQLAAGRRVEDVLNAYPILISEDLQAAVMYAMLSGEWEAIRSRITS